MLVKCTAPRKRASLTELRIQVEPAPDCEDGAAMARRLQAAFHDTLSLRVPVICVERGSLPRFELKARRWTRADTIGS